jgi:PAS domain S-box-containing protein
MIEIENVGVSHGQMNDVRAALDEHAIVAITDAQGKITYVNDKFCAISGYSRAELLGRDHRIVNSGHHPAEFMRDLWNTIAHGRVWHGEIKNRAKGGTYYWVATTIVPSLNDEGKPTHYVAIRTDITRRRQVEEDFKKLNAELEQRVADRTAGLEAFSYSASHDLRGPLRTIGGYAELLLEDFGTMLPDEGRRRLNAIESAARRMEELIQDLLSFARTSHEGLRREPVDTARLVTAVWAELDRPGATRAVEIRVGALPASFADPALLKQIWINLLSNALKYTAKREKTLIEVGASTLDGIPTFFVRDNGAGFDMRNAGKLFAPFERLHRSDEYAGTGVGLAIVRRIVSRHGGRVWAEAAVDQGATFYFTLST